MRPLIPAPATHQVCAGGVNKQLLLCRFRPQYPQEVYRLILSHLDENQRVLAVDVATGNGQAAVHLAEYFKQVRQPVTACTEGCIGTVLDLACPAADNDQVSWTMQVSMLSKLSWIRRPPLHIKGFFLVDTPALWCSCRSLQLTATSINCSMPCQQLT